MSIGGDMIDAVWTAFAEARATLRSNGTEIATAISVGLDETRAWSDNGSFMIADLRVRIKAEDALDTGMEFGDRIEVKLYGESDYTEFRIIGKRKIAGLINYALENVNE